MKLGLAFFGLAASLALVASEEAFAGSPLICAPIEVDGAATLPFGKEFFEKAPGYDVARLEDDLLARLAPATPVLVRMETIRRAAVYARDKRDGLAGRLLARLAARALDAEAAGKKDALAWFDAGYAAAAFAELGIGASTTGHEWIHRAIELSGGSAEMEFAAYLVTIIEGERLAADRAKHLRRAIHGAADGSLLAKNLVARVGGAGRSLAALRESHPSGEPPRGNR